MSVLNLLTFWAIFPSVLSLTGSCSISGRSSSIFSVVPFFFLINHGSCSTGRCCWSAYTIYNFCFFLNCSFFCRFRFSFYTVEKLDIWVCDVDGIIISYFFCFSLSPASCIKWSSSCCTSYITYVSCTFSSFSSSPFYMYSMGMTW